MAYNEALADRIRTALASEAALTEKKMFGGIAFMLDGNMVVGITGDDFMVRVGPDAQDDALQRKGARPMDFTGRPMKAMVYVSPEGYTSDADFKSWLTAALDFVRTLPAKKPETKKPTARKR